MTVSRKKAFTLKDHIFTLIICVIISIVLDDGFHIWPESLITEFLAFVGLGVIIEILYARFTNKENPLPSF